MPRPKNLTADPTAADGPRVFKYWIKTVQDYLATFADFRREKDPEINNARIIRSLLSPEIFA